MATANDLVTLSGYHESARIGIAKGGGNPEQEWIYVFHNHSSHFFVGECAFHGNDRTPVLRILHTVPYYRINEDDTPLAYHRALMLAVHEAMKR